MIPYTLDDLDRDAEREWRIAEIDEDREPCTACKKQTETRIFENGERWR